MTNGHEYFSSGFREAQQRLRNAAKTLGVNARHYVHPLRGLEGEPLGTDVYLLGNPIARKILVVESGTHGVEGFAGSAIQLALVDAVLPGFDARDFAIIIVHAVNPYGFSWRRRGDEQNVDINRNFVDFKDATATINDLFDLLAPHLVPECWTEETIRAGDAAIEGLRRNLGGDVVSRALRRGQYVHPGSVFFGGAGPTWSRVTVEKIAREYLASATDILLLDVHTGLGGRGELQLLTTEPATSAVFTGLKQFVGPRLRSTADPASGAANATGNIFAGYARCLPDQRFAGVALEFGTVDQAQIQRALRADAWAYLGESDLTRAAYRERSRQDMLDAFCPTDSGWRDIVVREGLGVFRNAVDLIAGR